MMQWHSTKRSEAPAVPACDVCPQTSAPPPGDPLSCGTHGLQVGGGHGQLLVDGAHADGGEGGAIGDAAGLQAHA